MVTPIQPVAPIANATRILYDALEETPFAYARRGHDFYRLKDHTLWAHESEGSLLSARTGAPFAYRVGRVFYDATTELPIYYERE